LVDVTINRIQFDRTLPVKSRMVCDNSKPLALNLSPKSPTT
jgi:hypothetical protein